MVSIFAVLAGVCWVLLVVVDLAFIFLAFQTGAGFGLMTLFAPFYTVTSGNWRLKTARRKAWAATWWGLFVLSIVFLILSR
jgi:hypothetical protein